MHGRHSGQGLSGCFRPGADIHRFLPVRSTEYRFVPIPPMAAADRLARAVDILELAQRHFQHLVFRGLAFLCCSPMHLDILS